MYDPISLEPLPNVEVVFFEESNKQVFKYLTNNEGVCTVNLAQLVCGKFQIQLKNYFPIVEFYGEQKLNLPLIGDLQYPLIRKPSKDVV